MKKGFTLIELLAVIVILAIIALIATPTVLKIIETSRLKSFEASVLNVMKEVELEATTSYIDDIQTKIHRGKISDLNFKGASNWDGEWEYNVETQEVILYTPKYEGYEMTTISSKTDLSELSIIDSTDLKFNNSHGGSLYDAFYNVIAVPDGYLASGYATSEDFDLSSSYGGKDSTVVKYDLKGNLIWEDNFGGTSSDWAFKFTVNSLGKYVGATMSSSNNGEFPGTNLGGYDVVVVKYETDGSVYDSFSLGGTQADLVSDITAVSDGYILVGRTYSSDGVFSEVNSGEDDAYIMKIDESGNVIWVDTLGGSLRDTFNSVQIVKDGYIAVGSTTSSDGDFAGYNNGLQDIIVAKYGFDGSLKWLRNYGGSLNDEASRSLLDSDSLIIIGHTESTTNGFNSKGLRDGYMMKINLSGDSEWITTYGGSGDDAFRGLSKNGSKYIASGWVNSSDYDLAGETMNGLEGIIVSFDSSGAYAEKTVVGGSGDEVIRDVIPTASGYIIAGNSDSVTNDFMINNNGDSDSFFMYVNK